MTLFFLNSLSQDTFSFFFFNDTATTEIYTLSLHDALPICSTDGSAIASTTARSSSAVCSVSAAAGVTRRSEEHTSELQSPCNLVCRLLLEKKKYSFSMAVNFSTDAQFMFRLR